MKVLLFYVYIMVIYLLSKCTSVHVYCYEVTALLECLKQNFNMRPIIEIACRYILHSDIL